MTDNSKNIAHLAASRSRESREHALELYLTLSDAEKPSAIFDLLDSPERDLREAALDTCTEETVTSESWLKSLGDKAENSPSANVRQAILVILGRIQNNIPDRLLSFASSCLEDDDLDVRYQAFCFAELKESVGETYLNYVRHCLNASDTDFRIVAIQAVSRLKPDWAEEALISCEMRASDDEAFQILLAHLEVCTEQMRPIYSAKLSKYIQDARYSFPAIQAAFKYENPDNIASLLATAKGILTEPTVRVAAAGAAAKLGSVEGRKLLIKFATAGHENPIYAQELLDAIDKKQ